MRRIAALTALLSAVSALVLTMGSAAMAAAPADPLTITYPKMDGTTTVPYGTNSLVVTGSDKQAGDGVFVASANYCDPSAGFLASSGNWSCSHGFAPITNTTTGITFQVAPANSDGVGPSTMITVTARPSEFSVTTPSTATGKTVTVTGVYDAADPMTDVSAVLKHAGDADIPGGCNLTPGGTFACTFTGVKPKSGYTVEATQGIEDSDSQTKTTAAFTVKSKTTPPPPPPTNPPPTNPPQSTRPQSTRPQSTRPQSTLPQSTRPIRSTAIHRRSRGARRHTRRTRSRLLRRPTRAPRRRRSVRHPQICKPLPRQR